MNGSVQYRELAKDLLQDAERSLSDGTDDGLLLCALKLRQTMEALTYAKAQRYEEDLGPKEMRKWQPRQMMHRMLEVDPIADRPVRLEVEVSEGEGAAIKFKELASDTPISLEDLKKNYDALGSFLHVPTMQSIEQKGWHSKTKLRRRCVALAETLRKAVESNWTLRLSSSVQFDCHRCGQSMRRHLDCTMESRTVACWHCDASYLLTHSDGNELDRKPLVELVACANKSCAGKMPVWRNDLKYGASFTCETCGVKTMIAYSVVVAES